MRVGVEKAVIDDLLDIVLRKLKGNLIQIIAQLSEPVGLVDLLACDVLHNQHLGGGVLMVDNGAGHVDNVLIKLVELVGVVSLDQKVHFLLGCKPHLVQHHFKVDGVPGAAGNL